MRRVNSLYILTLICAAQTFYYRDDETLLIATRFGVRRKYNRIFYDSPVYTVQIA